MSKRPPPWRRPKKMDIIHVVPADEEDDDPVDVLGGGSSSSDEDEGERAAKRMPDPAPAPDAEPEEAEALLPELWNEIARRSDVRTAQALLLRNKAGVPRGLANQVFRALTFGDMASPLTREPYTIVRILDFIDTHWAALHARTFELDVTRNRCEPATECVPSPYPWTGDRSGHHVARVDPAPVKPANFWQQAYALANASMRVSLGAWRRRWRRGTTAATGAWRSTRWTAPRTATRSSGSCSCVTGPTTCPRSCAASPRASKRKRRSGRRRLCS